MVASTSTSRDPGAIGQFAVGEFALGDPFFSPIYPGLSEPRRFKRNPKLAVALSASGYFGSSFVDPSSRIVAAWLKEMERPKRFRRGLAPNRQSFLAYLEAPTQNAPFGRGAVNFAEQTAESKYHYPWSEPKRFKKGLRVHLQRPFTADTNLVPAALGIGWFANFSEPKRFKRTLGAPRQVAYTADIFILPERNNSFSYPYSEPRRFKRGLKTHLQQAYTADIFVLAERNISWLKPYDEPVRSKKGLQARYQVSYTADTEVIPTSRNMAWYANYSEPVRFRPALRVALQQTFTIDTLLVPTTTIAFLQPYGLPVRFKQGLSIRLQQTLAYHPRILPNPDVTMTMDAIETLIDEAEFVYDVARATGMNARVSIIELRPDGTPLAQGNDPVSIQEV
jgi:hypothetical protein